MLAMLASYSYTCHLLVSFEAVFDQFSGKKWSLIFFWKFIYPGLQKMAKIEVCYIFENSRTQVYKNWPKMNFDIFLEIPGSTKIG